MSENPIEALEETIGRINDACDDKHGWVKDPEVKHWLVSNINSRLITVRGQLGDIARVNHEKAVDVLNKVHDWLGKVIRDGKCDDHCHECIGASDLADDVWDVLHPEGLPLPVDRPADCPAKGKPCPMAEENKAKVAPSPSKLEDTVRDIVCEQLGVNAEQVVLEASFMDDLGADSLDCVELVMAMEEEFGIMVPELDAEKLTTVGKAIDYLRAKGF